MHADNAMENENEHAPVNIGIGTAGKKSKLRDVTPLSRVPADHKTTSSLFPVGEDEEDERASESVTRKTEYLRGARFTARTTRNSAEIKLADARMALSAARATASRASLLLVPGYADLVNDTVRMARDASLLSRAYQDSDLARSRFLSQVVQDRSGIQISKLVRKIDHVNYMRVDFRDVMMFHPTAWGFPEADRHRNPVGVPGRERDPVHGWLWQKATNADSEMADVVFAYRAQIRLIPNSVIEGIAKGTRPAWLSTIAHIEANTETISILAEKVGVQWEQSRFLQAGLVDPTQVYVKVSDVAASRRIEPDPLSGELQMDFKIRGFYGLKQSLGVRKNPLITPAHVRALAFQCGVLNEHHYYWMSFVLMRVPLLPEWAVDVSPERRMYIHLPSGQTQLLHPYLQEYAVMLTAVRMAEVVWDSRGAILLNCDECGALDALVMCMQCSSFMCFVCFVKLHTNRRNHWVYPLASSRYLTEEEVCVMEKFIPITNVGACCRRRFLARSNQSDKTGTCQCFWLHFASQEALDGVNVPLEKERAVLQSIAAGNGVYLNMATGAVTDNANEFLDKSRTEQMAVLGIQAFVRGKAVRGAKERLRQAVIVIQKHVRTYLTMRRCADKVKAPLRMWFDRFRLLKQRSELLSGLVKLQAIVKRVYGRGKYLAMKKAVIKIQGLVRGHRTRRRFRNRDCAALQIQRSWRAFWQGPKTVMRMQAAATRVQARMRGILCRRRCSGQIEAAIRIQALMRGALARNATTRRNQASMLMQTAWRRFASTVQTKFDWINELNAAAKDLDDCIRLQSMGLAAVLIQKTFRAHRQRVRFSKLKRDKASVDVTASNFVSAFGLAAAGMHAVVHAWFRLLPEPVRVKVGILKGVIQRGICRTGSDLAGAIVGEVVRQLITGSGSETGKRANLCFEWTLRRCCHVFASLEKDVSSKIIRARTMPVGTGAVDARVDEPLLKMGEVCKPLTLQLEKLMKVEAEAFALTFASNVDDVTRSTMLVGEVLVAFREFLDQPRLKLDSKLAFQGVDSTVSARILDIIGFELGLDLPATDLVAVSTCGDLAKKLSHVVSGMVKREGRESSKRRSHTYITRKFMWGSFRDAASLAQCTDADKYARHVKGVASLFDEVKTAIAQEHYTFVLAVVLIQIVVRGVCMRTLCERAASVIQTKYKYFKTRTLTRRLQKPAIVIQRFWRGLRSALLLYKKDEAARCIQRSFRAFLCRNRNQQLINSVRLIQAVWRGSIQRMHIRMLHARAVKIQAVLRGHLVRLFLGHPEGRMLRSALNRQIQHTTPLVAQGKRLEYSVTADEIKKKQLHAKQSRARTLQRKIDQYRKATLAANVLTIKRQSVFEPFCFARHRLKTHQSIPSLATKSDSGGIGNAASNLLATLSALFSS